MSGCKAGHAMLHKADGTCTEAFSIVAGHKTGLELTHEAVQTPDLGMDHTA